MLTAVRSFLVPDQQRRTLPELAEDLDLSRGDRRSKRTAFWTMLVLAAVIASTGILADSTATVIGAMIIAPLSTPIMGLALAIVERRRNASLRFVLGGALLVVVIGWAFAAFPAAVPLDENSQVSARVAPGLLDLVAALATGLAGAVALSRRDVAAVLPGVAIAISLVPPLAVVGVCLGHGQLLWAMGALLLFLSNLVALVLAGIFVFTIVGYEHDPSTTRNAPRHPYLTLAGTLVLVLVPLGLNTTVTWFLTSWTSTVHEVAEEWVAGDKDASITGVEHTGTTFVVRVRTPGSLPPTDRLMDELEGQVLPGLDIEVELTQGRTIDAGTVGDR